MNSLFIYTSVLVVYLGLLVLIGVVMGRRLRSAEDFYIGGRNIGAWVTALSFVAAYFSSVVIVGGGGFGYKFGLSTLWIGAINVFLGCTLCWIVMGRRLREITQRLNTMTIPEFLYKKYNSREAQVFSAMVIVIFMIVYNVSILKGMGHIFEGLMNMPYAWGVLLSGVIIIIYVAIGGYLAVVWTGAFQAVVMGAALVLLTVFTLKHTGGLSHAVLSLERINPGYVETPGVWGWGGLLSFALTVSFGVWGMPQMVIRFYSIKNVDILRIGTVLVTLGGSMALLPYLNGAISRVLFPSLPSPDLAIPTLTRHVLSDLGGAIFLSGVIAAGMSTFSSVLIIISSSLVRDVMRVEGERAIFLNRIWSAVAGIVSLLIALKPPALVLVLCAFAWAVIASVTLWPILFGIYKEKVKKNACLVSMGGGFLTSLIWIAAKNPLKIHGFIPGILVGLLLFVMVDALSRH